MPELVGELLQIRYDPNSGQYRNLSSGRFVGRSQVLKLLDQEVGRTEARLAAHTRLLTQGTINLPEWQIRMAQTLKESHLRMGMFAAGGKERMNPSLTGATGVQLRKQYQYLDRFAHDIAAGRLTPQQAIARSRLYGKSIKLTFFRVEKLSRKSEGFMVGKRLLDPQAKHCRSCIRHHRPDWVEIDQIVSPGTSCECQNNCRCQVLYAKLSDLVQQ